MQGGIEGRKVIDLGCGNGILSIGAWLLGAKTVTGVEIDNKLLQLAIQNSKVFKAQIKWLNLDIRELKGEYDTVLQNPPFGTKKRSTDILFLKKALQLGKVVYSIHKSGNRLFISKKARENRGIVTHVLQREIQIPWCYIFHIKPKYTVEVEVYRIVRQNQVKL